MIDMVSETIHLTFWFDMFSCFCGPNELFFRSFNNSWATITFQPYLTRNLQPFFARHFTSGFGGEPGVNMCAEVACCPAFCISEAGQTRWTFPYVLLAPLRSMNSWYFWIDRLAGLAIGLRRLRSRLAVCVARLAGLAIVLRRPLHLCRQSGDHLILQFFFTTCKPEGHRKCEVELLTMPNVGTSASLPF